VAGSADFNEAAGNHVQHLRDLVALRICLLQTAGLAELPFASRAVLVIAYDDSGQQAFIGREYGIWTMMMLHCRLFCTVESAGETLRFDIILAPAFLEDSTALTMLVAILMWLPIQLSALKRLCRLLTIVVGTDGALSCGKVGRHFRSQTSLRNQILLDGRARYDGAISLHMKWLITDDWSELKAMILSGTSLPGIDDAE